MRKGSPPPASCLNRVTSTMATRIWRGLEAGEGCWGLESGFEEGRRWRLSVGILEEGWAGGARERDRDGGQAGRSVGLQTPALVPGAGPRCVGPAVTAQPNPVPWDTGKGWDRPEAAL